MVLQRLLRSSHAQPPPYRDERRARALPRLRPTLRGEAVEPRLARQSFDAPLPGA